MYTKCPSCRSEISFEPPANMENLPDGYKHRIKCPSCGVTIGVKIPKVESAALTFTPQNEFAVTKDTVIPTGKPVEKDVPAKKIKKSKEATGKKSGIIRNIFMLIFSLLFIVINILAYLAGKGIMDPVPYCDGFESFNGIGVFDTLINNFATCKEVYFASTETVVDAIFFLLPAFLFVLAGIDFIVAFIAAIGKKYSRAFNLIWALLIAASAIVIVLQPFILGTYGFVEYFTDVVLKNALYGLFIAAGIGILQLLFSLFFLASMKKKK